MEIDRRGFVTGFAASAAAAILPAFPLASGVRRFVFADGAGFIPG